jgi:hypothetical protein
MINIVFWNLNRRPLQDLLAALVRSYAVDLLVLAENAIAPSAVLYGVRSGWEGIYRDRGG